MSEVKNPRHAWKPEESDRRETEARIERANAGSRQELRAFTEWLWGVRGLARSTIATRIHGACIFVDAICRQLDEPCESAFRSLTIEGVEDFFVEYVSDHSPSSRRNVQAAMRLFLRFAADRGWVDADLVGSVPSLVSWRLSGLPRGVSEEELSRLLSTPFKFGLCPRRDWALVCLLAIYGVRRGQVSALRLGNLDWRGRSIEFAAHKGGKGVRHSLTDAVAEALARYLRVERPKSEQEWVFLRHRRPYERLSPAAITNVVQMRATRRGLGTLGPHAFRRAFAGRMLAGGQSMKTIADLLGHRSLSSVGLYAKIDFTRLAELADEWPEVES